MIPQVNAELDFPVSFIELLSIFDDKTAREVNDMAYNASYSTSPFPLDPIVDDFNWRESAFQFCKSKKYGDCSIISFNYYEYRKSSINEYFYQLVNGSCYDTASVPSSVV